MGNKATAGPFGSRLPCSQSCKVLILTPHIGANVACDIFSLALIIFGADGSDNSVTLSFPSPLLKF
jgi:hypothetical protein